MRSRIASLLTCARVLPLVALEAGLSDPERALLDGDLERLYEIGRGEGWGWTYGASGGRRTRLATALVRSAEFRSVLYYRLGHRASPVGRLLVRAAARAYPGPPGLTFQCQRIGKGLFISHGQSSVIDAERIGENCRIHQNVTIGWKNRRAPVIGNGVTIFPGAVIVGGISIGDGAVVGANAVPTRDVPAGKVAAGVPARIIGDATEVARSPADVLGG